MTNSEAVNLLMNSQYYEQGYKQGVSNVLDKIRAEIERQEKWLMVAGYNAYNVDLAFDTIKLVLAEKKVRNKE